MMMMSELYIAMRDDGVSMYVCSVLEKGMMDLFDCIDGRYCF